MPSWCAQAIAVTVASRAFWGCPSCSWRLRMLLAATQCQQQAMRAS